MANVTLNEVIDDFRKLPLDEKEYVIDIIEKQMIEAKREAISKRAKRAILNLKILSINVSPLNVLLDSWQGQRCGEQFEGRVDP